MKISQFTNILSNDDNYIIFNSFRDKVMICTPEIARLIMADQDNIDSIQTIHPSLYKYLKDNGYIIPDTQDDMVEYQRYITDKDDTLSHCSITINPTMDCNLSCWYCYEEHIKASKISTQTLNAIKKLLSNISIKSELKSLDISFFGGEPLMQFDNSVKPIIEHVLLWQNHINLTFSFTSNAVLLTKDIVDYLKQTNIYTSIQIPFDGNREKHNSVKTNKVGKHKDTYNVTLSNLKYAVEQGLKVTVRCNYTATNIESFSDLIDDIHYLAKDYASNIRFSFQRIWQDARKDDIDTIVNKLKDKVNKLGYVSDYNTLGEKYRCYADKKNSFVINYDGNIFQCTARNFLPHQREGYLCEDGTIKYTSRYDVRMQGRFANPTCNKCSILPICNICTQKRLEFDNTKCILPNSHEDKLDMIRNYISYIINAS